MTTANSSNATTFAMPSDNEIVMTRVFDAPRRLVFDAHTIPAHVQRWLLGPEGWTMPVCEIDLRPGGAWHYVWRRSDGSEMEMRGIYTEVVPHERLVCTERWGPEWPETLNTIVLVELDGKTTLTQRVRYPSKQARDAAFATGMKDGANESYDRLAEYLATLVL
ncbi:MAG TPA: SRPBCC family protein [Roseiflexaceae bacterium]|nr:SRPBCC family protein [Roseiflexaceae bacterium]